MAKKSIKFSLVYRDMWQSSGKYVPRVDQLKKVAPHIIDMGCFSRIETNGGGFEQINLLFGENPNNAVREWTKPFNDAGIETHMLERALNGIRMSPVPSDVRKLMYKVKKAQGVDIARSFCGLNDVRNIEDSITFAKDAGMISQAAMSVTYSKVHTSEYYVELAKKLIDKGADEICLKDMAGVGRRKFIGAIVKGIKDYSEKTQVTYHGHTTPGFAVANILEAAENGADYIDCAMEPLSWGTVHADVLTVQAMLKDAGFDVPEVNMDAYMKVRSLTQEFIDDFLGFYISPRNRFLNSLLIKPGLPGGMMGSLMADLENNLESLNKWKNKNNQPEVTEDELLIKLFNEVEYVWPRVGYPPLVTPFSQYVKNLALFNVIQLEKGKERWTMIADNIWDMMVGKSGQLPGDLAPEIKELATKAGKEFYNGKPQEMCPDKLDEFRAEMDKNGWDYGQDDEELFELAMHPEQYRAYKSGDAKKAFEEDIAKRKAEKNAPKVATTSTEEPKVLTVNVNGDNYRVSVAYGDQAPSAAPAPAAQAAAPATNGSANSDAKEIAAPLEGKFYLVKDNSETALKVGDTVEEGQKVGYIESMKTFNAISADVSGKIVEIVATSGESVDEDDILFKIQ
jgi:pyruvate carboxylase subunit B